jgi:hypothetical protein
MPTPLPKAIKTRLTFPIVSRSTIMRRVNILLRLIRPHYCPSVQIHFFDQEKRRTKSRRTLLSTCYNEFYYGSQVPDMRRKGTL